MKVAVGGVYKAASAFVGVAGAWKPATLSVGLGGAWKATAGGSGGSGLSITPLPSSVSKTRLGAGSATTNPVAFSVSGGVAPYTYAGVRTAGSAAIVANAPSGSTSTFTGTVALGDALNAVFTWTVTDSLGATASCTCNVSVTETT